MLVIILCKHTSISISSLMARRLSQQFQYVLVTATYLKYCRIHLLRHSRSAGVPSSLSPPSQAPFGIGDDGRSINSMSAQFAIPREGHFPTCGIHPS